MTYFEDIAEAALNNAEQAETARSTIEFLPPQKIEFELLPVSQITKSILPEPLAGWIFDISGRMQSAPDFAAANTIVLLGVIIGTGCGIKPKLKDNWLVVPNLYGGIIAKPSSMKSPVQAEVLKALSRLEIEAKQQYETELRHYKAECLIHKVKEKKIEQEANKGSNIEVVKQQYAALQSQEPKPPIWRRYRTNDATIEKLSELLNLNPRGLLVTKDELTGLLESWNKDGRECDRAFYLEAWNGYGDQYTDRIGRGTIYTENMCLSVFGGIQPDKLQQYLFANRLTNDGMFQRFQLTVYPDDIKNWKYVDEYPDSKAKNRAFEVVKKLSDIKDFTTIGARKEEGDKMPYLRFTAEAQELFVGWLTKLETEKIRGDNEPVIAEHLAKYRSLMPALALIFHLVDVADGIASGDVSLKATQNAAAWCDYLEQHARRIYGMVSSMPVQSASALSRRIARGELESPFTVRDLYRRRWSLLIDAEVVRTACDILVSKGWLVEKETAPAFQQRGKTEYHINPQTRGFYK